jgi:hypothetical protein
MRYYRSAVSGGLISRNDNTIVDPMYDEVQVAPLDAIVIERKDLRPAKTTTVGDQVRAIGRCGKEVVSADAPIASAATRDSRADWHRAKARAHLSIAEYLDAHPAVDQSALDALTEAVQAAQRTETAAALVRALYDQGVRVVSGD